MLFVDNETSFQSLLMKIRTEDFVIHPVMLDAQQHFVNNKPSLIFLFFKQSNDLYVYGINHNEIVKEKFSNQLFCEALKDSSKIKFVLNKKNAIHCFKRDYDFVDLNIIKYLQNGVDNNHGENSSSNGTNFILSNFRDYKNLNKAIPVFLHVENFFKKFNIADLNYTDIIEDSSFKFMNNLLIHRFAELERVGISVDVEKFILHFGEEQHRHIKNETVYSEYNLFTSTGRPSNRFGGVNFAALNKSDGSRTPFVSRHKNDGMLVMIDYSAFHPRLIANLVNYELSPNINPYEYLAEYFFKTKNPNAEQILYSKTLTFQKFYGGIQKKYENIPYFKKIQEYINHRWKYFEKNGFVETPMYFRKIKNVHIENPSPNKLFNYILQAYETEVAVERMGKILDYLRNLQTKPILYTYDSLLFDVHKSDGKKTIKEIKEIMVNKQFPVKIYVGKNYNDMRLINL
jgi:hypothetical protein